MKTRAVKYNNALRALAASDYGQQKESIVHCYKATTKAVIMYAAPIWSPNLAQTHWDSLQRIQNDAMRTATGCIKMTGVGHLTSETNLLPIRTHTDMISAQFAASCYSTDHPCHDQTIRPTRGRLKKKYQSLFDKHKPYIENLRNNNPTAKLVPLIHQDVVRSYTSDWINPVLGTKPPDIDVSEQSLSRSVRVKLSRLRSSFSPLVRDTRGRYDKTVSRNCPRCPNEQETVQHYLRCTPDHPIDPKTLWLDPAMAAAKLHLT